jgi:predicted transcriptional regulator
MFSIVIIGLVLMLSPAVALAQNNDQADAGHQTPEMTEPYDRSSNQQDEIFNRLDEISKRLDEMTKRQDEVSRVLNDISAELKVQANEQKNLSYKLGSSNTLVIISI